MCTVSYVETGISHIWGSTGKEFVFWLHCYSWQIIHECFGCGGFFCCFVFNDVHFCPTQWPLPKLPALLVFWSRFLPSAPVCRVDLPLQTEQKQHLSRCYPEYIRLSLSAMTLPSVMCSGANIGTASSFSTTGRCFIMQEDTWSQNMLYMNSSTWEEREKEREARK